MCNWEGGILQAKLEIVREILSNNLDVHSVVGSEHTISSAHISGGAAAFCACSPPRLAE